MIFVKNNTLKLSIFICLSLFLLSCSSNLIAKKDASTINKSRQIIPMITRTVEYLDDDTPDKKELPIRDIKTGYFIQNKIIYIQIIYTQKIKPEVRKRIHVHGERITVLIKGRYTEDSGISNILSYVIRVQMRPKEEERANIYKANVTKISDKLYFSGVLKLAPFDRGRRHKLTININNIELMKAQSLKALAGMLTQYDREVAKKYFWYLR